jgi:hypothetical protein
MPGAGDRRDQEQQQEEQPRRDRRRDAEEPHQIPEREERERSDSVGVLGLIKRMLPSRQPQKRPYVFKAFPTSSDW